MHVCVRTHACVCVHQSYHRFAAAEQDCTASLSLDPTYTKALFRRATARTKLKKHKDALQGVFTAYNYFFLLGFPHSIVSDFILFVYTGCSSVIMS